MTGVKNRKQLLKMRSLSSLILFFFWINAGLAQVATDSISVAQDTTAAIEFPSLTSFFSPTPVVLRSSTPPPSTLLNRSNLAAPKIYNYQHLGIFCKLDVQLDQTVKLPVRFRLGSQEVVDRKEGKVGDD